MTERHRTPGRPAQASPADRDPAARFFRAAGLVAMAGVLAMTAAACGPTVVLNRAAPEVAGQAWVEQIYSGPQAAADGAVVVRDGVVLEIQAARIDPDVHYRFDGHLKISGDTPAQCHITTRGPITIDGNVGAECRISSALPMAQERETRLVPRYSAATKSTQLQTVSDGTDTGLLYPEGTPAGVTITGEVGPDAKISSKGDIVARGADASAQLQAGQFGKEQLGGTQLEVSHSAPAVSTTLAAQPVMARPAGPRV